MMSNFNNGPHILLGNGFNLALQSLNNSIKIRYGYQDILNEIKAQIYNNSSETLSKFIKQENLNQQERIIDIERLLWILSRSSICLKYDNEVYTSPKLDNSETQINNDFKILKEKVIKVMTDENFHPEWHNIFNTNTQKTIDICAENLKSFHRIFTTNYDLILYWLLNEKGLLKKGKLESPDQISDGQFQDLFMNKVEGSDNLLGFNSNWNHENLCYLHGTIHLLSRNMEAFKVTRGDSVMRLSEIRTELLKKEQLIKYDNCIVFNASSDEKLDDILYGCQV